MKTIIYIYRILITHGLILLLFTSCSNEEPSPVKHSFQLAINVTHEVKDYNQVEFKDFEDLNLGFFKGNIWIKLEIKNEENENKSYMFISNDRFNRNYIFYKLDSLDNSLKLANQIKDNLKKDNRTFNNPNPNLKIDLAPKEQATYLITTSSDGRTKDATPKIISLENYFNVVNDNTIWSIVFYGAIICLLIINIYQWNIYKQKIYFYYIVYIISTFLVYLGIEGYLHNIRLKQIIIDHFIFVSVKLWALSLIIYTSKFLEIEIVAPRYYRFVKTVLVVVLGGTLIFQFTFYETSIQHLHYFENVLTFLWLFLIIGVIVFSAKARKLELKYYLIPLFCFLLFTSIGLVDVHFQVLPGNSFSFVKLGAIVELVGFTYFMGVLIKRKLRRTNKLENELHKNRQELTITSEKLLASEKLLSRKKSIDKKYLISVLKLVENSLSSEADWKEFKLKFKDLNPSFHEHLLAKHPNLSKSEIRMLTLIQIGYSQKEIATILNIAPDSVKKAKSRVRKKLNLPGSVILNDYLDKI